MLKHLISRIRKGLLVGIGAVALGMVAMDTITINVASGNLREEKSRMSPPVVQVVKGQSATVLEKSDKWVKLQVGDQSGWIFEDELDPAKKGKNAFSQMAGGLAGANGQAQSSDVQEAAAGKGLNQTAERYAKARNYKPEALQKLVDLREKIINSGDALKFAKEGHLK